MATQLPQQQYKRLTGVVVSAGKMMKTVKVRITEQRWNKQIQKNYTSYYNLLVSDPKDSTLEGDIVTIRSGWRSSKHVRHVLESIVAPMSTSVSERPAIPTEVERLAQRAAKRAEKDVRQAARGRPSAIARLKALKLERAAQGMKSREVLKDLEKRADELLEDVRKGEDEQVSSTSDSAAHAETAQAVEAEILSIRSEIETALAQQQQQQQQQQPQPQQKGEPIEQSQPVIEAARSAQESESAKLKTEVPSLHSSVPGGEQEVGDINQRSLHNVRRTIKWRGVATNNEEKLERMERKEGGSGMTPPERVMKPGEENQKKKGWFGSIFGGDGR